VFSDITIDRDQYREVIDSLNNCLEGNWTHGQLKDGMKFEVKSNWLNYIPRIVKKYRSVGWHVEFYAEIVPKSRSYTLRFKHPKHM